MSQVLAVDGLRKSFGDLVAVDGVGFHVESGETYGLLGPNGAGKTTTISMIAGLLAPDAGKVVVAGEEISVRSTRGRNRIGFVPQDLAIYPDLTCRENLVFFGRLYGLGGDLLKSRVDEVLEVIGLTDRAMGRVRRKRNDPCRRSRRSPCPIVEGPSKSRRATRV